MQVYVSVYLLLTQCGRRAWKWQLYQSETRNDTCATPWAALHQAQDRALLNWLIDRTTTLVQTEIAQQLLYNNYAIAILYWLSWSWRLCDLLILLHQHEVDLFYFAKNVTKNSLLEILDVTNIIFTSHSKNHLVKYLMYCLHPVKNLKQQFVESQFVNCWCFGWGGWAGHQPNVSAFDEPEWDSTINSNQFLQSAALSCLIFWLMIRHL